MNKNGMKIVWAVAFAAFAFISCYATAESLHLLLPTWPRFIFWIVTIGFFVLASAGSMWIVTSFTDHSKDNRGGLLVGGIITVLLFWACFSFPTNTHTFFYRNVVESTVDSDITTTSNYLSHVSENQMSLLQIEKKINELENKVEVLLGELTSEIMNEVNPGFGKKSQEILAKFAPLFGVAKVEPLSYKSTSKKERERLCDQYRDKIYALKEARKYALVNSIVKPNPETEKEVKASKSELSNISKAVDNGELSLSNPKDVLIVNKGLNKAYNIIKNNKDNVNFNSEEEEMYYTIDNPVTKVARLLSVIDVWKDYIQGKYKGRGFIVWIIASLLVDLGAFLFFNLAFKKEDRLY